jgi:NAD(P)H-dependent FMN reductase
MTKDKKWVLMHITNHDDRSDRMKILIFYGSVRRHRQGIKAALFVEREMKRRGYDASIIDPREYDFGLLDLRYFEYPKDEKPPKMKELSDLIKEADGFIVVSGEYNSSIPPALTNLMDHFYKEYWYRPCGLVSYSSGRFSGARAVVQLRSFLASIGLITTPTTFMVPKIKEVFDDNGVPIEAGYEGRFQKFADEFEWYLKVFCDGNKNHPRPD